MRSLSLAILILLSLSVCNGQSPHGKNFKRDCQDCHKVDGWTVNPAKILFRHSETGFELKGQHQIVKCTACHESLVFSDKKGKDNCSDCHTDIHENTVGKNCVRCHDSRTWIIENIIDLHRMGKFPLLGNHAKADCQQCHRLASSLKFEPLGIRCYDCHAATYAATKNPSHIKANYSTDCQQCHNFTSFSWSATSVTHDFFPLTGAHNIANCFTCHSQGSYKGLSQDCYTCHQTNYEFVPSPNHMKLNFSKDCKQCHTISAGSWKPASFVNHDLVYPLLGAHNLIRNDCMKCHSMGYNQTARQCVSCHQQNYDATVNPNHKSAQFSTDCTTCHSQTGWKPSTFDHDNKYFPIYSGNHGGKWNTCSDCHTNQSNFKVFECINCHEHAKTDMDSKHSGVNGYAYQSNVCYTCHPRGSKDGGINHSLTNFPLIGAHTTVACSQCHQTSYAGTPTQCVSCHLNNFASAPNHSAQNYPQDCKQCHSPANWKQISFNHTSTNFLLLGAHATVNCSSCHTTKLAGTSKLCYSCHQSKYTSAPNHVSQGYPQTCEQCHNTTDWKSVTFNHATTKFPLVGSHTTVQCNSCHTSVFAGTPTLCYSCHQSKYTAAPNHVSQGYPQTCEQCHNTTDWKSVTFNHALTKFPLVGSHTTVQCSSCHASGFAGTPTLCYSCHQSKYTAAPNHVSQGYPQTCEQCHNTIDWKSVTFNHATTKFPLTGSHVSVTCISCHSNGYVGTSTDCYSCHQAKFISAPDHVSKSYPTDCKACHTTTSWQGATFDHATTAFPLTGAHTSVNCNNCHTTTLKGTSTVCSSCHTTNFQSTTNPNHAAINIPTTCEQCHTTNAGWKPATFPIHNNYYQILGAHLQIANQCSNCHAGNYNTKHPQCVSCHLTDYNSVTNPNHATAKFPLTCEQCHTQNAWKPSTFNHDGQYFPIYSGEHRGKWTLCTDCHTNQTNYKVFECINCHEHSQSSMNSKHSGVNNYVYLSTACYNCHPTGKN
ncbi:MAG: cytochrome c3 family protein [Ignavibacteriales bacterium]|nr:cytochrome c3 family protein [Ignavibacteriales bacterium]